MRSLMKRLPDKRAPFQYGKLRGYLYPTAKTYVLGIYDEELFSGTDRLSMAVQPDAVKFLETVQKVAGEHFIVFEGDRLFNQTFLNSCAQIAGEENVQALVLTATEETKTARHIDRKDTQTEKFLKGRATKYRNVLEALPWVTSRPNEMALDCHQTTENILRYLGRLQ